MTGFVAMRRDWQDHDIFEGDEFSRRDAWAWLIAHAAWKPTKVRIKGTKVELGRGELCFAVRFLAEKWGWSKSKASRFLHVLRSEGMISTRSKIGTTAGHHAGQGQSIITICNYDKFQNPLKADRDTEEESGGTTAGQQRDKEEQSNKLTKEPKKEVTPPVGGYAFEGRVIRLTPADYDQWAKSYPAIDLRSSLQSRDDWLFTEADEKSRKKWFISTSNHLANLQQKAAAVDRQPAWDGMA